MTTPRDLLVEVLVEELPPKALKAIGAAFAERLAAELVTSRSVEPKDAEAMRWYATPRRIAVHVPNVRASTPSERKRHKLMPRKVAFAADNTPTVALQNKLRQLGYPEGAFPTDDISMQIDGDVEYVYLDQLMPGRDLSLSLQSALDSALRSLPIPKVMQYQLADGWTTVAFVRPAHALVALHGDAVMPVHALGLEAGRATLGHRFDARLTPILVREASSYEQQLRDEGAVIASFADRRAEIARQLAAAAASAGLTPIDDAALLDEVTALVELPNVVACSFEAEFLEVPPECLILTMKANQKYFPLLDAKGALTNRFLVVSNIAPADMSRIVEGNERVVRPRLADAKFFFDQDRKRTLESRVEGLNRMVYHAKLGTQGERTARVRAIATQIAHAYPNEKLGEHVDRAAELAKADLLTDMVGEFPELQGVMGGYYARHDGEFIAVAEAIEDHYKPRFAGDALPRGLVGVIIALADKLETLVGLFGIGQLPTGDKDPFALRRHALGVIRMLIEKAVPVGVGQLVALAVPAFGTLIADPSVPLLAFINERLAGYLREQGHSAREVDAVLSTPPAQLSDLNGRLVAVHAFAALPEAASLASANKRVGNILKKSSDGASRHVRASLLVEPAEAALHAALLHVESKANLAFDQRDYAASLQALAALKAPVDAFFDSVMVNADDLALRANRLGLLARLQTAMNRVADLSKLAA